MPPYDGVEWDAIWVKLDLEQGQRVRALGEKVWERPLADNSNASIVGMRFTMMTESDRDRLESWCLQVTLAQGNCSAND